MRLPLSLSEGSEYVVYLGENNENSLISHVMISRLERDRELSITNVLLLLILVLAISVIADFSFGWSEFCEFAVSVHVASVNEPFFVSAATNNLK